MASFGGSVKLTGESEYKKALGEIRNGLRNMGAEMKLASAQMQSADRNTNQLKATSADLAKKIAEEKKNIGDLKTAYSQMAQEYDAQKKKTESLAKEYDSEKKKLEEIKKALGESSPEYKKQAEVVDKLETELKESEQAEQKMGQSLQKMSTDLLNAETQVVKAENSLDKMNTELEESGKDAEKAGVDFQKFGEVALGAMKALAVAITAVATATVGAGKAVYDLASKTAEYGDTIDKESQKLQISSKTYQELDYAMKRNGSSIGDVSKAIKGITQDLGAMAEGGDGARDIYEKLGISLTDAGGNIKSAEDVLLESIDALARMEDTTKRNDLATQLFGKSYQEMLPLLNAGGDGIRQLMQEAEDYGMVMSEDAVKASAAFVDSLTRLKGTFQGVKNTIGAEFMPAITDIMDGLSDLLRGNDGAIEKIKTGVSEILGKVKVLAPEVSSAISGLASAVFDEAPEIMKSLAGGLMDALPMLLSSISNIATQALNLLLELAPQAVNVLVDIIPQIINGLLGGDTLGKIVEAGVKIITSLAAGISSMLPSVAGVITGEALPSLVKSITSGVPQILKAGVVLLKGLLEAVPVVIDTLLPELGGMIWDIVDALTESADILADAGLELFGVLTEQVLPQILTTLEKTAPSLITTVASKLMQGIGKMQTAGGKLFSGLVTALMQFLPVMIKAIPLLTNAITTELTKPENMQLLAKSALEMFMAIGQANAEFIRVFMPEIPKFVQGICEALLAQSSVLANASLQLFNKIIDSIKAVGKKLIDEAKIIVNNFSSNFIKPLQDKFVTMRSNLQSAFSGFAEWFRGVFADAWSKVQGVFSNWGSFFSGLWGRIKSTFSNLGSSIAGAIGGAVKSGINSVITMIQNTINQAIDAINGAINIINKIPKVSVGKISRLSLPRLAKGGIVDEPTLAEIGENYKKEAIVPLEENTGWIKGIARELSGMMYRPTTELEKGLNYETMVEAFKDAMQGMKVVLDDEQVGSFVTKTVADAIYT